MCVVSNIGDGYRRDFPQRWPTYWPHDPRDFTRIIRDAEDQKEIERLRDEVKQLKKLLEEADKFDKATGQVECQDDEKTKFIKELAKALGVEITCI